MTTDIRKYAFLISLLSLINLTGALASDTFHSPDKVYLHLDRSLYTQGDTIWMKGYAFERGTNLPSNNSYAIHVQMLNAEGEQVRDYKLLTVNGEGKGQIPIFEMMDPGFYQLIAHSGYMKNFDSRFFYKTVIEIRKSVRERRIITNFDKSRYKVGDTATVSFKVVDQNQSPISGARFVYDYSFDGKRISRKGLHCYDDGTISIQLPILKGNYKASPEIKLSFLEDELSVVPQEQKVRIPIVNDELQISFFPEGGYLISGIRCRIAMMSRDFMGNAVPVEGDVYKNGTKINHFSTVHDGMGLFVLQPDENDRYFVKITSPEALDTVYALPEIKEAGFALSYINQDANTLNLSVSHNLKDKQSGKLWISYCDSLISVRAYQLASQNRIRISKDDLPNGIVTFTVSDEHDVPQAERLIYIMKDGPQLTIDLPKTDYSQREKVEVNLGVEGSTNVMLSVAVVDSFLANSSQFKIGSIKAYAELESELKGIINNPNQYMGHQDLTVKKRDLLLMTHGWRSFNWVENNRRLQSKEIHDFNGVYGKVERMGKPYPDAKLTALMLGKTVSAANFTADSSGRFDLHPAYEGHFDQDIQIMAVNKKGRRGVNLMLQNTDTLRFGGVITTNKDNYPLYRYVDYGLVTDAKDSLKEESFFSYNTQVLDEFTVSADSKEPDVSDYFKISKDVILGEDLEDASSFEWLLLQTSDNLLYSIFSGGFVDQEGRGYVTVYSMNGSVQVFPEPTDRIIVRTYRTPYEQMSGIDITDVIFDSINTPAAMIYVNDKPWGYDIHELDFVKAKDISAIAILDGKQGYSSFGVEAYFGAIMIYTKSEDVINHLSLKRNHAVFGDFIKAREFSEQLYEPESPNNKMGYDKRITLHWEPLLKIDSVGKSEFSFYSGDIPGVKTIIIQGFDDAGNLFYQCHPFYVKTLFDDVY